MIFAILLLLIIMIGSCNSNVWRFRCRDDAYFWRVRMGVVVLGCKRHEQPVVVVVGRFDGSACVLLPLHGATTRRSSSRRRRRLELLWKNHRIRSELLSLS